MLLVIVISVAFFIASEIKAYVKKIDLLELQLQVIILQQQAEIGELKNRILELELDMK